MTDGNGKAEPKAPREIEREIEYLRTRLDRSLAELDRRRHELTDVRLQARKHPAIFIGAGAVLLLTMGGVSYAIYRSRKRDELPQKVKRVAARRQPPVWEKILAAVGTTIAVSLTKKLIDRSWNRTLQAGRAAPA